MNKILVIGCTAITKVIVPFLCSDPGRVNEICIAAKNKEECDEIKKKYKDAPVKIVTAGVDVTNEEKALLMMRIFGPTLIVNLAPSHLNKTVMEIALKIGANYIDAAYFTDETGYKCRIEEQFDMTSQFVEKNLTAVTGCSFDLAAYVGMARLAARMVEIKSLETLDIVDVMISDEQQKNETPTINDLRRLSEPLRYIEDGEIKTADALSIPAKLTLDDGRVLDVDCFDEAVLDTFKRGMPEAKNVCYFSQVDENFTYLVRTLTTVGMLSTEPVDVDGTKIAPIDFLDLVLPKAGEGGDSRLKCIKGIVANGAGEDESVFMSFECKAWDLPKKYEVDINSFFAGITLLAGTILLDEKKWSTYGVFTPGDFNPEYLINKMKELGIRYSKTTGKNPLEIIN